MFLCEAPECGGHVLEQHGPGDDTGHDGVSGFVGWLARSGVAVLGAGVVSLGVGLLTVG